MHSEKNELKCDHCNRTEESMTSENVLKVNGLSSKAEINISNASASSKLEHNSNVCDVPAFH